jgi:phage/plasmid-like protein (TIGR03299 family)
MAHNVETMAYVGKLPWHGLGQNLGDRDVTGPEMLRAAGLDWQVRLGALYTVEGAEVPSHFAIHRLDTGAVLGVVGSRYAPVQNAELFGIPDMLVKEGICGYHTAGSLRDGRIVWALARMGEYTVTRLDGEADLIQRYLLWTTRHDGLAPVVGGFTDVRVVCNNTLDAAMTRGLTNRFSIRHTASASARLDEAHRFLNQLMASAAGQSEEFQRMARVRMDADAMRDFATEWLGETAGETKKEAKRRQEVAELVHLFEAGRGNTGESLWDAFNSVTEWLDHHRARYRGASERIKAERKLESTLCGQAYAKKGKARALLTRVGS